MVSPLNRKLKFFLICSVFIITSHLSAVLCHAELSEEIRVAIIKDASLLNLVVRGAYEIIDLGGRMTLLRGKNLNTIVTLTEGGISFKKNKSSGTRLLIKPKYSQAIVINGRTYRGKIEFIKKDAASILVINHINLEDYIKGILYNEASHYWPMETLKAQAVACRTYAAYQMQQNQLKEFDLTSDIYAQVYTGKASERYRLNKAIKETEGEILIYQDKAFPTYYHATCAGYTEDASLLWSIDIAPLKGVQCGFCYESPHFGWEAVLSKSEIRDKLNKAGKNLKDIGEITILGRDKSFRVTRIQVNSSEGNIEITAKDFRQIIGPNIIKSTNFNLSPLDQDIAFEGKGWGHGVGLCQWGAYFMAKQGYNYRQILEYYYPGSKLEKIGALQDH